MKFFVVFYAILVAAYADDGHMRSYGGSSYSAPAAPAYSSSAASAYSPRATYTALPCQSNFNISCGLQIKPVGCGPQSYGSQSYGSQSYGSPSYGSQNINKLDIL